MSPFRWLSYFASPQLPVDSVCHVIYPEYGSVVTCYPYNKWRMFNCRQKFQPAKAEDLSTPGADAGPYNMKRNLLSQIFHAIIGKFRSAKTKHRSSPAHGSGTRKGVAIGRIFSHSYHLVLRTNCRHCGHYTMHHVSARNLFKTHVRASAWLSAFPP